MEDSNNLGSGGIWVIVVCDTPLSDIEGYFTHTNVNNWLPMGICIKKLNVLNLIKLVTTTACWMI